MVTKPRKAKRKSAARARGIRIADVAKHFGVAVRTVSNWRASGMPGELGRFDLAEIAAWRAAQGGGRQGQMKPRDRLNEADAQLKELKLARERGELVPAEAVVRLFRRHIGEANVHLRQLPEEIVGEFGQFVPPNQLARLRQTVQGRVDAACLVLADLLKAQEIAHGAATED